MKLFLKRNSTLVAMFLLIILATIFTDGLFVSPRNLTNLARQVSINGILAVGMTYVILISGIDLSVGSVVALSSIAVGISQISWGWSQYHLLGMLLSTILGIGVGALCGVFNAYWISKHKMTSFIITLGMMVIARGLALIFSHGEAIAPMSEELQWMGNGYLSPTLSLYLIGVVLVVFMIISFRSFFTKSIMIFKPNEKGEATLSSILIMAGILFMAYVFFNYRGLPIPVLLLALVAGGAHFVLTRMTIGRYIYAIGGNPEASRLSGVPIQKVTFFVFVLMGVLSGLCSVILTGRLNGAMPTSGQLFELDAIAAVVIGGTSLMGGIGTVTGSLIGAFMIGILNNSMSLLNVPTFYQMVIKGLIIILAVFVDSKNRD
ncbi:MAG TPA: inner-membrane translocator [Bdellovibrionota bacterium]|nr:inner-membrane translocator [Bdellovibrionota bacterium]